MSECRSHEAAIRGLLSGLLAPSEREALDRHAEECGHCRELLAAHDELEVAAARMEEPSDEDFERMRNRVITNVRLGAGERGDGGRVAGWRGWLLGSPSPAMAVAGLAVLVIGAAMVGRWSSTPAPPVEEAWMGALQAQAAAAEGVADSWDAPFLYRNVSARPTEGGRLALSFDVTRHVTLETERGSDLAKDVLVHAILDASPIGTRVNAMGLATEIMDARLREAVAFALHHDSSVAVRLAAFDVLTQLPFDASVQAALLTTLRTDESVHLRLKALEFLSARRVGGEVLRQTIDEAELEGDNAVRYRSAELTRDL